MRKRRILYFNTYITSLLLFIFFQLNCDLIIKFLWTSSQVFGAFFKLNNAYRLLTGECPTHSNDKLIYKASYYKVNCFKNVFLLFTMKIYFGSKTKMSYSLTYKIDQNLQFLINKVKVPNFFFLLKNIIY